mmetsp:Transcript_23846/g.52978  ORF Transcript_23846/g.52978 Transcript_23846/m.52978 type:complete len:196 (+) Transcript_23846:930-1517(+)
MLHLLPQERLRHLLHLAQNHRAHLLGRHDLLLGAHHRLHHGLVPGPLRHLKGQQLGVLLHRGLGKLSTDEALHVEYGVLGVGCGLVLGRVAHEALAVAGVPSDVRGRNAVALLVGADLHPPVLPHRHAAVCGSQIDADASSLDLAITLGALRGFFAATQLQALRKSRGFFLRIRQSLEPSGRVEPLAACNLRHCK